MAAWHVLVRVQYLTKVVSRRRLPNLHLWCLLCSFPALSLPKTNLHPLFQGFHWSNKIRKSSLLIQPLVTIPEMPLQFQQHPNHGAKMPMRLLYQLAAHLQGYLLFPLLPPQLPSLRVLFVFHLYLQQQSGHSLPRLCFLHSLLSIEYHNTHLQSLTHYTYTLQLIPSICVSQQSRFSLAFWLFSRLQP